jgi:hypothetical protein
MRLYPISLSVVYPEWKLEHITQIRDLFTPNISIEGQLIRMGDDSDGGYVVANDFSEEKYCLSFGVGSNWSFDTEIAKRVSQVIMFDHTVTPPEKLSSNMTFIPKGVATVSGEHFISIHDAFEMVPIKNDVILKIDIEGDEWDIINSLTQNELLRCSQIIVELHNLHAIGDYVVFDKIVRALGRVNENHDLVNLHCNNWAKMHIAHGIPFPDVVEVSYLRRKPNTEHVQKVVSLSSEINLPNNPMKFENSLSFIKSIKV